MLTAATTIDDVKKSNRHLALNKETLRELTVAELTKAAAGIEWTPVLKTFPPDQCVVLPTAGGECIPQ